MIPTVKIQKQDGNTGVVRPSSDGILAIIAGSSAGTLNQPTSCTRDVAVQSTFGNGRLVSFAAYVLAVAGNPIVACKSATSTAGAYGSVTFVGTGSSVVTGDGSVEPFDDYSVYFVIIAGGTIGVTGITFQYSLDGGATLSPVTALGTANNYTIPNTGVKLNFAAGTLVAADTVSVPCTGPLPTTTDLVDSLEALRVSRLPFEAILIDGVATSAIVTQVDTWLTARETEGRFYTAILNVRRRNAGETEAAYATAVAAVVGAVSSLSIVVCADGGDVVDRYLGIFLPRPASLGVAARGMSIDIAEDAAYVARGPLTGYQITDARNNPKYHDEAMYPGLDALRVTALRSFDQLAGTFINNPNLLSPFGGDYVYWQHARVMNKFCSIAKQILTTQLSKGIRKNPKAGPNGERYVLEQDAAGLEALVNAAFTNPKKGRVTDAKFVLSRTDDISSNGPATLGGDVQLVSNAYAKEFDINSKFVKQISAPVGG